MRIVGGVAAALITAATVAYDVDRAFAGETANGEQLPHFLLFSGFDLWRAGGFANGGTLWSPDGLGREGFTFKLLIAGGQYRYLSGATKITGRQSLASAMPGWRFVQDHTELTIFAGLDLQSHRFSPDDLLNKLRGDHAGVRAGVDFWAEPINRFMVTGSISASTIGPNIWSRAAAGVKLFDFAWFGPELEMMGDGHYRQFRAGAHVTALRTGPVEWSAAVGYAVDSDHVAGAYGSIGLISRQ